MNKITNEGKENKTNKMKNRKNKIHIDETVRKRKWVNKLYKEKRIFESQNVRIHQELTWSIKISENWKNTENSIKQS